MTALLIGYFLLFFVSFLIIVELSKNAIAEITMNKPQSAVVLKIGPFPVLDDLMSPPPIIESEFMIVPKQNTKPNV
jgi:hypothetical protein